jgi:tetratricopeptide (TPR) repeat protein
MLETLREFALEMLDKSGEAASLRTRHRTWCLELAESAQRQLRGPLHDAAMHRLDRDHDNLRAALRGAFDAGQEGVSAALRLSAALWFYWYQRGFLTDGQSYLQRALTLQASDYPDERAKALQGLASICRQQNQLEDALRYGEEALGIYRARGNLGGEAACSSELGAVYQRLGDFRRAATLLEGALAALRELGNTERVAFTLVALGVVKQLDGDLDAAAEHYGESLELARELDDKNGTATALVNLGEIAQHRGDVSNATRLFRDSLRLYLELGLKNAIAYCLEVLAGIDTLQDRPCEAAQLFGAAERLREEIHAPVEPFNLERYRRDYELARSALGHERFDAARAEGRSLPLARVVERAMIDATP